MKSEQGQFFNLPNQSKNFFQKSLLKIVTYNFSLVGLIA